MTQILVVDDETNVAKSVMRLLEEQNFKVFTASNGQTALETLAHEKEISIVISDQRMPLMTGAELFQKMKDTHPQIKRILLTGYTEMETLRNAINQGSIFRLLLKPWDDNELIACIEDAQTSFNLEAENQAIRDQLTQVNITLERSFTRKSRELSMNIQSLERYEKIIEQLPIGIVCLSADGMVILTNQQFISDFNLVNAVEGMPYNRVLPEPIHPFIENFKNGHHESLEYQNKKIHVSFNVLRDEKVVFGKVISIRVESR
ncbi:response regulator [Reinekea sp.]|jgi:YesN/AraC family two-component response regulator|uniref:response regulator n=1 Tax=Reinekea sp. TaxID=1970455 RepID=UPI003989A2AA